MKSRLKRASLVAAASAMGGFGVARYMNLGQPAGIMLGAAMIGFCLGFAFELRLM